MANTQSPSAYFSIKPESNSTLNIKFPCTNKVISNLTTSSPTIGNNFTKQPVNISTNITKLKETFLGKGYSSSTNKSNPYLDQLKAQNTLVTDQQIGYIRKIGILDDQRRPTFIFLGVEGASILSDQLSTWLCPRISKGWKFYGVRHQSCIYLWREPHENYSHSPESFYLEYFRAAVNGKDKLKIDPNDEKKEFVLSRLELGEKNCQKILIAVEVEAISQQKKEMIGVRLHREFSSTSIKRQQLSYWAEWVVNGWSGLIVGQRDYRGYLQDIQVFTENDKEQLLQSSKVGGDECLKYQESFLIWMENHLNRVDEGMVCQFSWSPTDWLFADVVICSQPPQAIFPSWYERKPLLTDVNNNY